MIGMTVMTGLLLQSNKNPTVLQINRPALDQSRVGSNHILQINFKYNTSTPEFKKQMIDVAPLLASVKGLKWKIWSIDEMNQEASGYYLFENEAELNTYLKDVFFVGMGNNRTVSNIVVKKLEILEEPTAITRGPIVAD
jgi:Putative mono-oxygenase ydhR